MPEQTLDWASFSARFFPGQRRHDLGVIRAYGVYKRASAGGVVEQSAVDVWEGEGGARQGASSGAERAAPGLRRPLRGAALLK